MTGVALSFLMSCSRKSANTVQNWPHGGIYHLLQSLVVDEAGRILGCFELSLLDMLSKLPAIRRPSARTSFCYDVVSTRTWSPAGEVVCRIEGVLSVLKCDGKAHATSTRRSRWWW